MPPPPAHPPRRQRVLLVPDFTPWILGAIARAIADHNPDLEVTILSEGVLRHMSAGERRALASRIDVVHFLREYGWIQLSAPWRATHPCAVSVHHIDSWPQTAPAMEADAIHYISNEWREEMLRHGTPGDRLVFMPNGVDTALFAPQPEAQRLTLRRALGIADTAVVVGFVAKASSNNDDRKGADILARAAWELVAQLGTVPASVQLTLLIVGPGWEPLVQALRQRGIPVVWRRFVPESEQFARLYPCMDLYWVTSRKEGGPVPLLEAMSTGVCGLTTPVGMAIDLVRDGINGWIVPKDDTALLVQRSLEMVRDPARRAAIAAVARRTMVEHYDWAAVAPRARDIYRNAAAHFARRAGHSPTTAAPPHATPAPDPYLAAIPPTQRPRVRLLEQAHWVHHLATMGEAGYARKFGLGLCLKRPWEWQRWATVGRAVVSTCLKPRRKRAAHG